MSWIRFFAMFALLLCLMEPIASQRPRGPSGLHSGKRFKRGFEMEAGDYRDTARGTWDKRSQLIPMLEKRFYKLKKPEYLKV
ncbi:hypothetical protein OS493_032449 [Desmophyllum pertusum]|uniref:Uncharacterized protein n=1 Tax=Desmophyllum pertusum TaxID=174260 RepID=A0A9X0D7D8_9CNID|nr:hypothetical protein OS493_032449 [Desmophyllum pertusum]